MGRRADGDGHAHVGPVVGPRVIGDGIGERERWPLPCSAVAGSVQMGGGDAAVEGLGDTVGGDEAEALRLSLAYETSRAVPPVHDEVGRRGHVRVGRSERVEAVLSERGAHGFALADEGRVADDEIGLGPGGDAAVRVEERVAVLDLSVAFEDGFGQRKAVAVGASVPLEVADPEHEVGHAGGARALFDAEHLVGRDGGSLEFERADATGPTDGLSDFAFERFEARERDVEEVARSAGGIEHADAGEAREEARE